MITDVVNLQRLIGPIQKSVVPPSQNVAVIVAEPAFEGSIKGQRAADNRRNRFLPSGMDEIALHSQRVPGGEIPVRAKSPMRQGPAVGRSAAARAIGIVEVKVSAKSAIGPLIAELAPVLDQSRGTLFRPRSGGDQAALGRLGALGNDI